MHMVEVDNLSRDFNKRRAVDALSFSIEAGEIFGLLGPNGAGKTTTIRMLTGQLLPSSGQAWIAGCKIPGAEQDLKPHIGVVFEQQNLYERMSGLENLAFAAQLYGVPPRRVDQVLDQVGLRARAKDKIKTYSNGMKQRLLLARAWLHSPKVLFLDEPTHGLDPDIAQSIRQLIREMAMEGMTVFLTTHYMEEADQLCQRIAFLNQGRIVALNTPEQLKLAYGQHCIKAKLANGRMANFSLDSPATGQQLAALVTSGQILTLHSLEATLDDVFIQLTGRRIAE